MKIQIGLGELDKAINRIEEQPEITRRALRRAGIAIARKHGAIPDRVVGRAMELVEQARPRD